MGISEIVTALLFEGDEQIVLVEKTLGEPGQGQIVLDIRASGVCGSDLHNYHLSAEQSHGEDAVRSAAITPGHEIAGVVEKVGPGVDGLSVGDRVAVYHYSGCGHCVWCRKGLDNHCLNKTVYSFTRDGGFQDKLVVNARDCVGIPDGMSYTAAAFMACGGATAFQAIRRVDVPPGGHVIVVGLGPVGLVTMLWLQAYGIRAAGVDPDSARRDFASSLGLVDIRADARDSLGRFDSAIDASGNANGRASAVRAVRPWGTVVLVGLGQGINLEVNEDLIYSQVTMRGSHVFGMPTMMEAYREAARLKLQLDAVLTVRCDLPSAPEAIHSFAKGGVGKTVVVWP